MEQKTVIMGHVTYELRRVFQGTTPLADLIAERLSQNLPSTQPVDGDRAYDV